MTLLELVVTACGLGGPSSRYGLARDLGSSIRVRYAMERASGLWVHLHCELRVSAERPLPDPIRSEEHGDLLSFTHFRPLSMGSAGLDPTAFSMRDGYRVWLWRTVAGEAEIDGRSAFGVQARWPRGSEEPLDHEGMEVFRLPPLAELEPYAWSSWRRADELRGGIFADWERLSGVGAETAPDGSPLPPQSALPPELPYELRCRAVLADFLHIPVEADDPNLGRPDPVDGEPESGSPSPGDAGPGPDSASRGEGARQRRGGPSSLRASLNREGEHPVRRLRVGASEAVRAAKQWS